MSKDDFIEARYDETTEAQIRDALGREIVNIIEDEASDVTDILVRPDWAAIESLSNGFESRPHLSKAVKIIPLLRVLAPLSSRQLGITEPDVEISLPIGPGIRVTALYAGPSGTQSFVTIRIPRVLRLNLDQWADRSGVAKGEWLDVLKAHLSQPMRGTLIGGGVGTGKTTFLRACAQHILDTTGTNEHMVVVEDNKELNLKGPQVTAIESTRFFTYRDALRHALRHRPTRLVVGEVRGGEAQDAATAGATGAGLLCSIHVDTAQGAARMFLSRMKQGNPGGIADPHVFADAIDLILVMRRERGKFRIGEAATVSAITNDGVQLQEVKL